MKERKFQSRFTPRRTDPILLEALHIAMDGLLERAFKGVQESAASKKKQHFLFHGSRGSGKSHLIRLLEYRISKNETLQDQLWISWLNEDESSTTFLDLLVRIYRALADRYSEEFPLEDLSQLYGKEPEFALLELEALLRKRAAGRTLLVLLENVDGVLTQLSDLDLKRWRAFLQNEAFVTTVATAQQLVGEAREHDEIFYGFFDTYHLRPFSVEEAVKYLKGIARENGDEELFSFLDTPRGQARVRALHRLSGGNPRLYVVFSDFISQKALDDLVRLFEELIDEQLTPYYQERLRWLSPLQRKIVEMLCAQRSPVPVKDIAAALFTGATSIATQLKRLREMGYVISNARGREALYELAEPLMRISLEVKKTDAGEPLLFIVDFLRLWYDYETLERWVKQEDEEIGENTQRYARMASENYYQGSSHLRLEYLREELVGLDPRECNEQELERFRVVAEESDEPGDWYDYAVAVYCVGDYSKAEEALVFFEKHIVTVSKSVSRQSTVLLGRALVFLTLRKEEEALADCGALLELDGVSVDKRVKALSNRGMLYGQLGRIDKELADYKSLLELEGVPKELRSRTCFRLGVIYFERNNLPQANKWFWEALKDRDPVSIYTISAHAMLQVFHKILQLLRMNNDWENFLKSYSAYLAGAKETASASLLAEQVCLFLIYTDDSSKTKESRVNDVWAIHRKNGQLAALGNGLVRSLKYLSDSSSKAIELDTWAEIWKKVIGDSPEFKLPMRLLETGVAYLKSRDENGKGDRGTLLALPLEEREILCEALEFDGSQIQS